MARVSVVGGMLTEDQLIMQLRRVVPVKWNWELKKQGKGNFLFLPNSHLRLSCNAQLPMVGPMLKVREYRRALGCSLKNGMRKKKVICCQKFG
jgi:hypothetical protein